MSDLAALIPRFDAAFDALEHHDIDTFVEICQEIADPQVEFNSAIGSALAGRTYKGIDGIRTWFVDLLETAETVRYRDRLYETAGDRILLMLARFELTGAVGRVPVSSEVGTAFEFEGGHCIRIDSFTSHNGAREFAEARVA